MSVLSARNPSTAGSRIELPIIFSHHGGFFSFFSFLSRQHRSKCCNFSRRDLESLCRDLDLGYTADAILPNDHRGRVTYGEFQRYFGRLPDSLVWPAASSDSSVYSTGVTGNAGSGGFMLICPKCGASRPRSIRRLDKFRLIFCVQFQFKNFKLKRKTCKRAGKAGS